MNPNRRRKKRPNYGIRTVEVKRGPNGFGFTISGQQPCILSCIVNNSPADFAGLRAGDFLISVNGVSVSKITHDAIVNLIGNCVGPIKMTVADNYYSDSSDEELDCHRIGNNRKPKYMHKPRARILKTDLRRAAVATNEKNIQKLRDCFSKEGNNEQRNVFVEKRVERVLEEPLNISNHVPVEHEDGPIEYKALVGYMGTIEMPKELLPSSRLQTVCNCIKKLRQEKRRATAVLMTVLPTCLTLKNASNHILAIYPTNRVVYIGSVTERESRYFGIVTSAVCDRRNDNSELDNENNWQEHCKKNNSENCVEVSNSCHVFVTDPKIVEHSTHQKKAEKFNITCTKDAVTGNCLEFPNSALYVVSLVQSLYKLQNNDRINEHVAPVIANSPQPSASSNSDSGIGYRDDCGNISDRILVVEFPTHNSIPYLKTINRPSGIDASNIALEGLDMPLNKNNQMNFVSNGIHQSGLVKTDWKNVNQKHLINNKNLKSVKQIETRNQVEILLNEDRMYHYGISYTNLSKADSVESFDDHKSLDIDYSSTFLERPIDVLDVSPSKKSYESISLHSVSDNLDFKTSVDNLSVHSSKSTERSNILNVFKVPFESKRSKKHLKMSSCNNLDKCDENFNNYKPNSKGYGLLKSTFNSEEVLNSDGFDKFVFGSLQDLCSWTEQHHRDITAQSEPDVRNPRIENVMVSYFLSCMLI